MWAPSCHVFRLTWSSPTLRSPGKSRIRNVGKEGFLCVPKQTRCIWEPVISWFLSLAELASVRYMPSRLLSELWQLIVGQEVCSLHMDRIGMHRSGQPWHKSCNWSGGKVCWELALRPGTHRQQPSREGGAICDFQNMLVSSFWKLSQRP